MSRTPTAGRILLPALLIAALPAHLVLPSMMANLSEGETHGAEVAAKWNVTMKWTLGPSYDFERMHMHRRAPSQDIENGPDTEGSDPRQHARLRSHLELPRGVSWTPACASRTGCWRREFHPTQGWTPD